MYAKLYRTMQIEQSRVRWNVSYKNPTSFLPLDRIANKMIGVFFALYIVYVNFANKN